MSSLNELQVVLLAHARDGQLAFNILREAAVDCQIAPSVAELAEAIVRGCGAILVAEECLDQQSAALLLKALQQQPAWSDLPFIVVTQEADSGARLKAFAEFGNVSMIARPMNLDTLTTATRSALRARRRQYEVRDLLREREAADRRKDEFLAMLAHELRNPLAPVRTTLHVLKLTHAAHAPTQSAVAIAERAIKHLGHLIDDLLDASRMSLGKVSLRTERIDMREVVRFAAESLRGRAELKRIGLTVVEPEGALAVLGDAARLDQALSNVLDNALKYTPEGGAVRAAVFAQGDKVVVRVSDNGVGIAPQDLPYVCDLFVQADKSLDRTAGGVGVGLTVAKGVIELHSGELSIKSEGPGRGTTVDIALPLVRAPEQGATRESSWTIAGQPRVLIVDDNRDGAESLATFLSLTGCETRTAYDGNQAISAYRQFHPSAVLLDIGLPGMSGYDVAEQLRNLPNGNAATLIAVTGYSREEDRARSHQVGFDYHLVKPVDLDVVSRLISEAARPKPEA